MHSHEAMEEYTANCFPEFVHINHYFDKQRQCPVSKILPGEFFISKSHSLIATTLGSCISACIWDEYAKIGGMNHFMLPVTAQEEHEVNWGSRGKSSDSTRYGNFAMEHLVNTILKYGGRKVNLKAKVFGGGKVLKKLSDVGERNIEFVLEYLDNENIEIVKTDVGSVHPRKVLFDPTTGQAFVKKLYNLQNDTIVRRENDYRSVIDNSEVGGEIELF
ncbi:chemoreceptor glutamine deamidase CheD [uncultured Psychrosphaera sp.]|uniref:chemoreceptor glutamine deamidase CheD n=1 Tax=uncultured Psychrosphaera sp. TaxID=1403522 RepID=UPI002624AE6F|nr:chemoreceptor glutamine deamidase CheD [uncultured Psychrosphaera sp.]